MCCWFCLVCFSTAYLGVFVVHISGGHLLWAFVCMRVYVYWCVVSSALRLLLSVFVCLAAFVGCFAVRVCFTYDCRLNTHVYVYI